MTADSPERPTLRPSSIGQFFRLQSCPMYLQWEYDPEAQKLIDARAWERKSLSPVLAGEGGDFERRQLELLDTPDRHVVGLESWRARYVYDEAWTADIQAGQKRLQSKLDRVAGADPSEQAVLVHQAPLSGTVGAYPIQGYLDFLYLESTPVGIRATVCEVKSTATQKVHHRYQATIYELLLEQLLEGLAIDRDAVAIETAIVAPENNVSKGLENVTRFNTGPYRAKLELKLQAGGSFDRTILGKSVDQTHNRIAKRCSGCEYEPLCVTRGVETQGLELLGLQAGTQETLNRLGVTTIEDLALLFDQPGTDASQRDFSTLDPVDEELVQRIRQEADVSTLQTRAQIAYRFLAEIDDDYGRNGPDFFPYELQGTGYNLPDSFPDIRRSFLADHDASATMASDTLLG